MDDNKVPEQPKTDQDQLSCDSCGWVIKRNEEVYAIKNNEVTCEHCLEAMVEQKELH